MGAAVAAEIGDDARFVELDVTSPEGWESADRIAEEEFGGLHGLSDWVLA